MAYYHNNLVNLCVSLLISGGIVALLFLLDAEKRTSGVLHGKSTHNYPYVAGNYLSFSNRHFSGMSIELPKKMPHIYLDHRIASKFSGPMRTYTNNQKLNLEGNFNKYFQLFIPKDYQVLALSIITPDIMQALMQSAYRYDIEIKGNRLNIIRGLYGRRIKQSQITDMQPIAAAIVSELDHKFKTWSKQDELEAGKTELTYYPEQSVRLFGQYIGIGVLSILISTIVAAGLFTTGQWYRHHGSDLAFVYTVLGMMAFPIFPILILMAKNSGSDFD